MTEKSPIPTPPQPVIPPSAPYYYPYSQMADDEIDLVELFLTIKRYAWLIILIVLVSFMGTLVYVRTLPNLYKAKSVIFSPAKSTATTYVSALNSLGMGALLGADATPVDIIVKLLNSRRMAKDLVRQFDLINYYQGKVSPRVMSAVLGISDDMSKNLLDELIRNGYVTEDGYTTAKFAHSPIRLSETYSAYGYKVRQLLKIANPIGKKSTVSKRNTDPADADYILLENTLKTLQGHLTVEKDKSSFITIGFEDRSPALAALLVNSCISNLDLINEELEITSQKPLVIVLDWAEKPTQKSKPNKKMMLIISLVTSTIGSIFLAFLIDYLRKLSSTKK